RRARVTRVARRGRGGEPAHIPDLVEFETESVRVVGELAVVVREQLQHGARTEDAFPGVGAAVQQRLPEHTQIPRRGEQSRVAGHPAQRPGVLVVYLAPDQTARRLLLE